MNYSMVKLLILKDWYLQRWMILGSLVAGALALAITVSSGKAAFLQSPQLRVRGNCLDFPPIANAISIATIDSIAFGLRVFAQLVTRD
jgi:hypothetical protein